MTSDTRTETTLPKLPSHIQINPISGRKWKWKWVVWWGVNSGDDKRDREGKCISLSGAMDAVRDVISDGVILP